MSRVFLALPIPEVLQQTLSLAQNRLRLARPVPRENLHATVLFLGEQSDAVLEELHLALESRALPAVRLQLTGFGVFGGNAPRSLHAALAPDSGLETLHARALSAARAAGLVPERRRFVPHVTLARFRAGEIGAESLAQALQAHGALTSTAVAAPELVLFRSILRRDGPIHEALASYPLSG